MFGAFTDDEPPAPCAAVVAPLPCAAAMAATPETSMALRLATNPEVVLKSQQRGEPDLETHEKVDIAIALLEKSPSQFLFR